MRDFDITLVTGGARSGKSSFGESLLKDIKGNVLYVATAEAFDDEMKDRIEKHRKGRADNWITLEGYKNIPQVILSSKEKISAVFLDCITIMITNLMLEESIDWDHASQIQIDSLERKITEVMIDLIAGLKALEIPSVLITNEVGLGIVPENKMTRIFRDIAGRINQYIAKEANCVYFVVCGIPNKIK
ncbi:adenosylcobinamide kinase /adenosylcobinamide-phosphate guanylyltransferase [Natronincola peptidivorans]|uniref:Adenosylcobinamide kinase n=1 Tax=Natronincola peptidivorans TaxID=426128 RepID=A0A1I0DJM1_9FIRM|nr:bifunctional adenosylcobinamide kinase/adenosylcobinamide-phosphate guanylyltransferase [Natronincola peptidivorans]SET32656.1 adenosylcobinamide kinase /adenosylcobinamide-phosphate guanylyltransferase [Natronincola peptidivorans]